MGLGSTVAKTLGAVVVVLGFSSVASAASLISGAGGSATCELNATVFTTTDCTLQNIAPHAAWMVPADTGTGAEWVSYANTGVGSGNELAPTPDDTSPTPEDLSSVPWLMKVTEEFSIGAGGGSIFLKVWADDTTSVFLNGLELMAPNFTQDICADGPIGCEPDEFFLLDEALIGGLYTLDFYVYQLGRDRNPDNNPFGLLYAGVVTSVSAPPGIGLFGLGLMVAGLIARRRS